MTAVRSTTSAAPRAGRTRTTIAKTAPRSGSGAPSATACCAVARWLRTASSATRTISGRFHTSTASPTASVGTTTRTQAVTSRRARGRSSATRGWAARPGTRLRDDRADPREQVRHAGEVGEDVVAVETQRGDELLDHLEVGDEHVEHQHLGPAEQVGAPGGQQRPDVEVQAPEVGAQPAGPVQAVGVGDVGVEGGEDEVHPGTDPAGRGAAVPARRRVTDLVDEDADGGEQVERREQPRRGEGGRQRREGVAAHEQQDVHRHQGRERQHDDGRPEQRGERPGDEPDRTGGQQRQLARAARAAVSRAGPAGPRGPRRR